jgi:hypothetical protein
MNAMTLHELKLRLNGLPQKNLIELCLRLAKYKLDNKEFMTYVLECLDGQEGFVQNVISEINEYFFSMNTDTLYFAKKTVRKIERIVSKYVRFAGEARIETELRLYFCKKIISQYDFFSESEVIMNVLARQYRFALKSWSALHEDLQFDYRNELDEIKRFV